MAVHASAHMSQALAHRAHISADMGERRIIMSAHMRVVSEQSMSARMICIWAWPPICMQELMVSSHMLWQDMHASTQSCICRLIGVIVPGWVMAPPGRSRGSEGAGWPPVPAPCLPSYAPPGRPAPSERTPAREHPHERPSRAPRTSAPHGVSWGAPHLVAPYHPELALVRVLRPHLSHLLGSPRPRSPSASARAP